jgi:polysaccharide chain length determinant protein (PEP-CTERM system associated)
MLPGKSWTPRDIQRIVSRRRWYLIVPPVLGVMAALLVARTLPNRYQSDTLIQIVPQRVPDSYVRSTVTTDIDDRLKSISQQIMSRSRLEQIISEFNLYPTAREQRPLDDVIDDMRTQIVVDVATPNGTRARPGEAVDAFHVRFTYVDPQIAMRVTERLANLFIDENSRLRGVQADATNTFLETQLAEARKRLEEQEKKLEEFRQRHAGRLPTQLQSNMQAIQNTQLQLQALVESVARDRDRRLMVERLYNDAVAEEASAPNAVVAAPGGAAVPPASPRQQLELAKQALAQAEMRLTPTHPDIKRLKRQIADLEARVESEPPVTSVDSARPATTPEEQQRRERIRGMRAEIESLQRQIAFKEAEERRLRGTVADYQNRIDAVPALESEWTALSRDYDTLQQTYKDLLSKSEDSKVAANLERRQIGEQFRVLDPARVPERPVGANRVIVNAVGLALGLVIALGLVAALELSDSSFHTENDIPMALALPVLATVPYVATAADVSRQKRRRLLGWTLATATMVVYGGLFVALKLWKFLA